MGAFIAQGGEPSPSLLASSLCFCQFQLRVYISAAYICLLCPICIHVCAEGLRGWYAVRPPWNIRTVASLVVAVGSGPAGVLNALAVGIILYACIEVICL